MKRRPSFEIYKDTAYVPQWRWRLVAANGRIIADSAEGYRKKASVEEAVLRLQCLGIETAEIKYK